MGGEERMNTEEFWRGEFGNEYTKRNVGRVEINKGFMIEAFKRAQPCRTLVELGAGSGENLDALHELDPTLMMSAVEINPQAFAWLTKKRESWPGGWLFNESLLTWTPPVEYDCSMTKGVLIHIAPEDLPTAYDKLYQASRRYIMIAEYFSPEPREIPYRGHDGKLWTRDFGGEMLDRHPDLKLLDVGFHYNRTTGQDNITHWLMEKK